MVLATLVQLVDRREVYHMGPYSPSIICIVDSSCMFESGTDNNNTNIILFHSSWVHCTGDSSNQSLPHETTPGIALIRFVFCYYHEAWTRVVAVAVADEKAK